MKNLILSIAIIASLSAFADKCDCKKDACGCDYPKDKIARAVFREGTNSSFVVSNELTQTERRFLTMGHQLFALAQYTKWLERRVLKLEEAKMSEEAKKALQARRLKEARERRNIQKRNEILKNAAKKASSGK